MYRLPRFLDGSIDFSINRYAIFRLIDISLHRCLDFGILRRRKRFFFSKFGAINSGGDYFSSRVMRKVRQRGECPGSRGSNFPSVLLSESMSLRCAVILGDIVVRWLTALVTVRSCHGKTFSLNQKAPSFVSFMTLGNVTQLICDVDVLTQLFFGEERNWQINPGSFAFALREIWVRS